VTVAKFRILFILLVKAHQASTVNHNRFIKWMFHTPQKGLATFDEATWWQWNL